jgi:hypothetical protein
MSEKVLLKTEAVARFVAEGFLSFEALIPEEVNQAFLQEFSAAGEAPNVRLPAFLPGTRWSECAWGKSLSRLLQHPVVLGAIQSLVGESPIFDHHHIHVAQPQAHTAQHNHQDSTVDPRETAFDIQLMYFPHEVTSEMGGTRYIPGTHLRRVHESQIARYQNLKGQVRVCCPAGTVLVLHHGLWHGAGRNTSAVPRFMYKLRLQPSGPQIRLWETSDLDDSDLQRWQRPIFHGPPSTVPDSIPEILMKPHPWFDNEGRLEYINRIRLWRALLGRPEVDIDYWMTRLETPKA